MKLFSRLSNVVMTSDDIIKGIMNIYHTNVIKLDRLWNILSNVR